MTRTDTPELLPFTDATFRADPYPYYARAREIDPVHHSALGVWAITRYADVSALLYNRSLSVERIDFGPAAPLHDSALGADVPRHTTLRRALSAWFTPKAVQKWRAAAQNHLDDILEEIHQRGGAFDGVLDLAFPVTFRTTCDLLGVAYDDALELRKATYDLGAGLGANPSEEEIAGVDTAMKWFAQHAALLIDRDIQRSGDGLLSSLLAKEADGELSRDEVIGTLTLIFAVGHLDITYLIVHGLHIFAQQPEVAIAYRDERGSRSAIIEEILRIDTPEQFVSRLTTEAITIGEVTIPAGELLILLISAANKDPEVFPDPDIFDHRRDSSLAKHLAFGGGLHGCAGQVLARAEADAVFTTVTERFGGISPTGPVEYAHTDFIRAISRLPLILGGPSSSES